MRTSSKASERGIARMYESHWGLQESPFRGVANARYFYSSPTHEEALARLHFLLENQRQLGLLLGGAGSGKSLVFEVFARQLKAAGSHVVSLNLLALGEREFLWELASQLHRNPRDSDNSFQLWRSITDRLSENRYQQLPTVLLLDDADEATPKVLGHLIRLLHQDSSPKSPLTMVMAADPVKVGQLGRRVLEMSELRIELETWDPEDTLDYIAASLAKAGNSGQVFDPHAASRVHELTQGVPRKVSNLAELALVAGAGRQLTTIDVATIDAVYEELAWILR